MKIYRQNSRDDEPKESYSVLAPYYDRFSGTEPAQWARYHEKLLVRHSEKKPSLLLDLACGTGAVTAEMARLGFDMIGVDISAEMLSAARDNAEKNGCDILLLQQDMTAFELYGTVDAAVCMLDSLNYLSGKDALRACFSLLHNYIAPGGILIFDVNTKYKFERIYGDNAYIFEDDGVMLCWQNDYDRKKKCCAFRISLFSKGQNGMYRRMDEEQTEYYHSEAELKKISEKCGFEFLAAYDELSLQPPKRSSERVHYVMRRKESGK